MLHSLLASKRPMPVAHLSLRLVDSAPSDFTSMVLSSLSDQESCCSSQPGRLGLSATVYLAAMRKSSALNSNSLHPMMIMLAQSISNPAISELFILPVVIDVFQNI